MLRNNIVPIAPPFFLMLLMLFCYGSHLKAQDKPSSSYEFGFQYGSGYILPEYQFFNLLTEGPTTNYEFQIQKNSIGRSAWERLYNYPSLGLRFTYSDLGNPDAFGQLWAIYPYFQIPVWRKGNFSIDHQSGIGYCRVNRKFDLEKNFMNVAVGSYGNIHYNTRFNFSYLLKDRYRIQSSISFDHFSNGNTAEPNLGINYVSCLLGLSYVVGGNAQRMEGELPEKDEKIEKELIYAIGGKHSRALASTYYFTSSLSFEMRKKFFRAFHLGAGADLFYDTSVEDQLLDRQESFSSLDRFQSGIHISQTIVYNKLSITFQEGVYLILKEKVEEYPIYSRGILKYRFTEKLSGRIVMKSHLHILDYPEIGIGWIL